MANIPLTSCSPKEPFIKLDAAGQAAILNYNLPQSTCYNAVSHIAIAVARGRFKGEQMSTVSPYWTRLEQIRGLSAASLREAVRADNNLVMNGQVLRTSLGEAAVSLGTARRLESAQGQLQLSVASQAREALVRMAPTAEPEAMRVQMSAINELEAPARRQLVSNVDDQVAQRIASGQMPIVTRRLSGKTEVNYQTKPSEARPEISIVLHLRMCSYLGDYGAGQTIKTFSLLPGEKTTITVRHYQQYEQTRKQAENVLDSFSESSAEDLQDSVEEQTQFTTGFSQGQT